jgi:hypothetical protein
MFFRFRRRTSDHGTQPRLRAHRKVCAAIEVHRQALNLSARATALSVLRQHKCKDALWGYSRSPLTGIVPARLICFAR